MKQLRLMFPRVQRAPKTATATQEQPAQSKATYKKTWWAENRERLNAARRERRKASPEQRAIEKQYRQEKKRKELASITLNSSKRSSSASTLVPSNLTTT